MRIPALFACVVALLAIGCGAPAPNEQVAEQPTAQPAESASGLTNFSDQIIYDVLIKTMPDMEEMVNFDSNCMQT